MNCLEEGLLNFLLPNLSSQQLQPDSQPSCFLASDHLSTNSFPERGYQGQARDGSARALIPSSTILDCLHRHSSLPTPHNLESVSFLLR